MTFFPITEVRKEFYSSSPETQSTQLRKKWTPGYQESQYTYLGRSQIIGVQYSTIDETYQYPQVDIYAWLDRLPLNDAHFLAILYYQSTYEVPLLTIKGQIGLSYR